MDAGSGLAEALADSLDVLVAVVDVGLAPEHGYPHSTRAGIEAVEWLLTQVEENQGQIGSKVDSKRIMIGGAGGGGTIATSVILSEAVRKAGARLRQHNAADARTLLGGADEYAFKGCLLITPMLECPNRTRALHDTFATATDLRESPEQWSGSKALAERVGATVMSSAQVDWGWEMYARAHPNGLTGCASSVECSPSSATDAQLKSAGFKHLVLFTASHDALFDEGAYA